MGSVEIRAHFMNGDLNEFSADAEYLIEQLASNDYGASLQILELVIRTDDGKQISVRIAPGQAGILANLEPRTD